MRLLWRRTTPLLLIFYFVFTFPAVADHASRPVLVIHSYGIDFRWTVDLDAAIRTELASDDVIVLSEMLDAKYHYEEPYLQDAFEFILRKYEGWEFDAIVVTDNFALEFIRRYRESLWPDTPVVFAGINDYTADLIAGLDRVTGVAENLSVAPTVDLMRRLFPDRNRLIVLGAETITGTRTLALVERAITDTDLEVVTIERSTKAVLDELSTELGPRDFVLLAGLIENEHGILLEYADSGRLAAESLAVPVFSFWDFYMSTGIAGGVMISGSQHGMHAAELVQRILAGEDPDAIPVVTQSPNLPILDYAALVGFGVEQREIPPDSVIYNAPIRIFTEFRYEIALAAVLFLSMASAVLIVLLIAQRRGRVAREAANSLREKETLLREVHHRVKNNLQVVSSMLNIQSQYVEDRLVSGYFQDCRTRVQSMALVHEHLYRSPSLARIEIREYVEDLVTTVVDSVDASFGQIECVIVIEDFSIDIDRAVPLGMVINELVSNAYKYAYPENVGTVKIEIRYDDERVILEVSDHGNGFTRAVSDAGASLGLQLVEALASQLNGKVSFEDNEPGARIRFSFPLSLDQIKSLAQVR